MIREIGRGGMGVVYLGVQEGDQFKHRVAIKVLKRGMDTEDVLHRFERERQLLAAMNHPNIARLYDGGETEDGLPFFVMEYVEGLPIDEYCTEKKFPVQKRLEVFLEVREAVVFAHHRLVLHCDLKPQNILIGGAGNPKLLDFGIATLAKREQSELRTGFTRFPVRSPQFASPEQERGEPGWRDQRFCRGGGVRVLRGAGHGPRRWQFPPRRRGRERHRVSTPRRARAPRVVLHRRH